MTRTLTHEEARSFYDRFGSRQDNQKWYEDAPLADLIAHADFDRAGNVFEFGTGTGRIAAQLLADHLPQDARYFGVDVSSTMVRLSKERLDQWQNRADVQLTEGSPTLPAGDGQFDRFLSTYVFDLLSDTDVDRLIAEAGRILSVDGKLCVVGLTRGRGLPSRAVSTVWTLLHRLRPALVGGCRPMSIADRLEPESWRVEHRSVRSVWGLASEVLCARKC